MCGIFVTPRNQSCQLTWKNVKAELRELKIGKCHKREI